MSKIPRIHLVELSLRLSSPRLAPSLPPFYRVELHLDMYREISRPVTCRESYRGKDFSKKISRPVSAGRAPGTGRHRPVTFFKKNLPVTLPVTFRDFFLYFLDFLAQKFSR